MTPKQKEAWREDLIITNEMFNPDWQKDEEIVARHIELMAIYDPESTNWKRAFSKDEVIQAKLDKQPGLEQLLLNDLKKGDYSKDVCKRHGVNVLFGTYIRKKYKLSKKGQFYELPERVKLLERYRAVGCTQMAKEFGVSRATVYKWLKEREIPRNKESRSSKEGYRGGGRKFH